MDKYGCLESKKELVSLINNRDILDDFELAQCLEALQRMSVLKDNPVINCFCGFIPMLERNLPLQKLLIMLLMPIFDKISRILSDKISDNDPDFFLDAMQYAQNKSETLT